MRKIKKPLNTSRPPKLVAAALSNDACRGCAPSVDKARDEAYVLLWAVAGSANGRAAAGNRTRPGFSGLRVAIASIRQHDAIRPIVVMALAHDIDLGKLAGRVHNLHVRIVPQILASRISNMQCRINVITLL